ncbi:MAG: methylmalonyl-CoA mutase family protein [Deltaproteobacteria bacterium]
MSRHPEQKSWEEIELAKSLERFPERKKEFTNHGGEPIPRLAVPETIDAAYLDKIGFPGRFPFTRGVQPTMYRGRLWTMRQYAGFSTAAESNARYRYLLEQGTTGLSIAFDLPTQIGYDSDHPMSSGEVGKVGVAIDTLADMEVLFKAIPLEKISTSMTINSPAAILLAMYVAVGRRQGVAPARLRGTIQNDVLKEYVARGTFIFPPKPSLKLITDVFAWCAKEMPEFNTISISGYHIRESGSTAVQEVAFTLANGITYVQAALDAGLEVDLFAPRLAFFLAAILGGTQSLHTNSRDEALSLPSEDSVRTALRTQQIIAYESGVANTVDPLAGSYFIEQLTDRIEEQAEELIAKIDAAGGVVACIEDGFIKRQIETAAYLYQKEIESGERIIVGVNHFQVDEKAKPPLLKVDPEVEEAQRQRLAEVKTNRDHDKVRKCLQLLEMRAKEDTNLLPAISEAVEAYASLGEICGVLRNVFGEYRD